MTSKGFKVTRSDRTSFSCSEFDGSHLTYKVGKVVSLKGCVKDGEECGHGIHLAPTLHQTLEWSHGTAFTNARFFECEYEEEDVLGFSSSKTRVSKCRVIREITLAELELPDAERILGVIRHIQKLNKKKYGRYNTPKIVSHILEHIRRLTALDKESRNIDIKAIRLHSPVHWASVWDSVWDSVWASVRVSVRDSVWASVRDSVWASVWASVRDSVWDSVRDSVWASVRDSVWDSVWASVWASVVMQNDQNSGLPRIDCILEGGGFFYGVDKEGIAHVIVPAMKSGCRDVVL